MYYGRHLSYTGFSSPRSLPFSHCCCLPSESSFSRTENAVIVKMLAGESLLLREKMCPTREMTDAYFSNHNLSVTPFESSEPLTLLNAVKENFGIAILPLDHYEYFYSSELKLINIPDFHYTRYIDFIYKKKTILSPLAQTFMQFVIQYIPLIQKTFCAKNKNTL